VVVLAPVLFCGGVLTLVFSVAFSAIKNEGFYEQAVARTRANAEVTAILGTPVDAGFPSGNLNRRGPFGHADLSIPISGPDGNDPTCLRVPVPDMLEGIDRGELEVALDQREMMPACEANVHLTSLQHNS